MKTNLTTQDLDPVSFWQLNAKPRFPGHTTEWSGQIRVESNYASLLGAMNRHHRQRIPFLEQPTLPGSLWRLAYYHRPSGLLSRTAAASHVREGCRHNGWMTDVPEEWIGASCTLEACQSLSAAVRGFSVAEVRSFNLTIQFFQAVPLEKHEVLQLPWFDLPWASCFTEHVEFLQTTHAPSPSL